MKKNKAFGEFKKLALSQGKAATEDLANSVVKEMVEVIEKQKFRVKKLSPFYAKYKALKKQDPRIFIATGEYLSSIKAKKIKDGSFECGPDAEMTHTDAKVTMDVLQRIHEYGTSKIPARPIWRKIHKRLKKTFSSV